MPDTDQERPLLAAVLMLKDERHTIARTLESCVGAVDHITVLDTGSTDGTEDEVRCTCERLGLPLHIVRGEFTGYASTRNLVLNTERERSGAAEFCLMLSADEVLVGGTALRSFLQSQKESSEGAFCIQLCTTDEYVYYPRVTRTDSTFHYVPLGGSHEKVVDSEGRDPQQVIEGVAVEFSATDPERRAKRLRDLDIPDLRRIVDSPGCTVQAMLLLAQTYENLADLTFGGERFEHMTSALGLYRRVAAEGQHETQFAKFKTIVICQMLDLYDDVDVVRKLDPLLRDYRRPEAALMFALSLARLDARAGLDAARNAARLAEEADGKFTAPVSRRCLWQSHLVAAHCARALGLELEAQVHAKAGLEAGGKKDEFLVFSLGGNLC